MVIVFVIRVVCVFVVGLVFVVVVVLVRCGKATDRFAMKGGGCSRHPVGLVVGVVVLVFVVTVVLVNVIVRALVVLRVVVVHVLVVNTPVHMQLPIRIGPTCPKRVGAASSLAPAVAS